MPRAADIDHVDVVDPDQPVEMDVQEVQTRRRAPVPEQSRLDVGWLQRPAQQGVAQQVDLPDGQVVRGPPPRVYVVALLRGQHIGHVVSVPRLGRRTRAHVRMVLT